MEGKIFGNICKGDRMYFITRVQKSYDLSMYIYPVKVGDVYRTDSLTYIQFAKSRKHTGVDLKWVYAKHDCTSNAYFIDGEPNVVNEIYAFTSRSDAVDFRNDYIDKTITRLNSRIEYLKKFR